ncbi:MAG TPA: glycosyltransferase family 4 protein, partial [Pyrinomonadaceae bacterium]
MLSYFGVEWFRRWSLKKQIYDIPNERSSHDAPKPRGGGLVFVVVSLVFYSILTIGFQGDFEIGYLAAAILISLVSWLDDLFSISFVWRFIVHAFSAFLVIYSIGYIDELYLPLLHQIEIGKMGIFLTFAWIVWLTNAYNFMDGIDGIAGTQAVIAGLGWFIAGQMLGFDIIGIYGGILAFSSAGFLIHNWQPAKIFMGDVGSAFLGFTFAVLPLLAKKNNVEQTRYLPLIAVLLVWFFVFDSVYTFVRRLWKRKKVWNAHREHIYQKLVIKG